MYDSNIQEKKYNLISFYILSNGVNADYQDFKYIELTEKIINTPIYWLLIK